MRPNPTLPLSAAFFLALLLSLTGLCARAADAAAASPYENAQDALTTAKEPYERWCALGRAAKASLKEGGHDDEAKALALELEKLAPKYTGDWNYGNAVQDFNIVLGSLALKAGDTAEAKKRLLAAGRSPGSPQMDSFGPNTSLALDLLTAGEKDVVLEYFELCRKFWEMEGGKLDEWKAAVQAGEVPKFGANLVY